MVVAVAVIKFLISGRGAERPSFSMRKAVFFVIFAILLIILSWDVAIDFVATQFLILTTVDLKPLLLKLKADLSGFYVAFLISLYIETFDKKNTFTVKSDDINKIKSFSDTLIKFSDANSLVVASLKKIYKDENIHSLARNVLPQKQIYRATSVKIRLIESKDDKNYFNYTHMVDMTIEKKYIICAITNSISCQDALFNIEEIDEVYCDVGFNVNDNDYLENFVKNASFRQIVETDGGGISYHNLSSSVLNKNEKSRIIGKLAESIKKEIIMLKLTAPIISSFNNYRYDLHFPSTKFSKSIPFVYWVSDRVLFLDNIEVDGEQFCSQEKIAFSIMPFICGYNPPFRLDALLCSDMPIKLHINSWVCYGQGIVVAWREQ